MSEECDIFELRELDAWIAEHVMGCNVDWHRGVLFDTPHCACNWKDDIDQHLPLPYPHAAYKGTGPFSSFSPDPTTLTHYTTSPADAMSVLEKCCSNSAAPILVGVAFSGYYCTTKPIQCLKEFEFSKTMELAICRLAKHLFGRAYGNSYGNRQTGVR